MIEQLLHLLKGCPKEVITVITAALPFGGLGNAIPVALSSFGYSPLKTVILAVIGSSLPIAPLLYFLEPISHGVIKFKPWRRFLERLFTRKKAKYDLRQRLAAFLLMLFVALPIPVTGSWAGCAAASLFRIRFRYAFPAIFIGVVIEGAILVYMGK